MSEKEADDIMYSHLSKEELLDVVKKSQDRVAQLTDTDRHQKLRIDLLEKKCAEFEPKAKHLDILTKPIQENELVRDAWERFTMVLRMAGYDESK